MTHILLGGTGTKQVQIDTSLLNRHGLIAGATGTGKTVSLQVMVEQLSRAGVPVFLPDVKGDLSGLASAGKPHPKVTERLDYIGISEHNFAPLPTVFWDVRGTSGHPLRTTISDIGPLLLSNLLELNETQTGILYACFKEADEQGWLMLDIEDLNAMLAWLGENAAELKTVYGNISSSSIGAIKRRLLILEEQGIADFLGEPALELKDIMAVNDAGEGAVNILHAVTLLRDSPRLYSTILLWLLSELFEELPEVGDPDKPKLVIFLDEAHLLFKTSNKSLTEKIENVVRLIRSKGVGVFFVSQNPLDIPSEVAGQLGLKIQHALRAFTGKDRKALKAVAESFRDNPEFETLTVLPELGTGEALVSCLDKKGRPQPVEKTLICPPISRIGPLTDAERKVELARSAFGEKYDVRINRESAHELLLKRTEQQMAETKAAESAEQRQLERERAAKQESKQRTAAAKPKRRASNRQSVGEALMKSISRAVGSQLGRQIARGILGSIFKR
jgi:Predicted ATPase